MLEELINRFEKHIRQLPRLELNGQEVGVVFNQNLRNLRDSKPVKYILVADNPGNEEYRHECYLHNDGKAGKIARNFFECYSHLVDKFDEEVAVLNKSYIHTPATNDLNVFLKDDKYSDYFIKSEHFMGELAIDMLNECAQKYPACELWIIGCSHLGKNKLFSEYLKTLEPKIKEIKNRVFCYQHFANGCFSRSLNKIICQNPDYIQNSKLPLSKNLEKMTKEQILQALHKASLPIFDDM
ncbi:MAG: hypothetical protein IJ268_01775 [Proteobacteria bacterium]|nr:hypothetical protein [Pseudomonadota bacterium]